MALLEGSYVEDEILTTMGKMDKDVCQMSWLLCDTK